MSLRDLRDDRAGPAGGVARRRAPSPGEAEIRDWLAAQLSKHLEGEPREIDPGQPFARYGLSSMQAASLLGDIQDWLGRDLPDNLVWDYPTVDALARHLAGEPRAAGTDPRAGPWNLNI